MRGALQRSIQLTSILAASLSHIRTPTTGAADELRNLPDNLPRLHFSDKVFGHADNQRNLAFLLRRAKNDDTRAKLVPQVVDKRPHLPAIQRIHSLRENFNPLHLDR